MMIKLGRNQILLWFSFVFVYLIINTTTTSLAQSDPLYFNCSNLSNYTANSVYETNLNTTFEILPTTNNGFGFYNLSTGHDIDRVNALALCRGDVNPDICLSCLNNAIGSMRQLCSYKIDAMAYYEYCSFIYNNATLLGNTDPWFYTYMSELQNTTNVEWFNGDLTQLMYKLIAQASNGGPLKKFASGNTTGPNFTTIYALVQCTPDLSKELCDGCLDNLTNKIPDVFNGKAGGTVFSHKCNIQYDIKLFFNESNDALVIPPPPPSTQPSLVISPRPTPDPNGRDELIDPRNQSFTFLDIQRITDSFNTVIGKGSFGTVFNGYIGNNQVAVKMLSESSAQGYREFQAEAKLADFGLSRAFATEGATHVSTVICGTPGYLDPQYYTTNRLTEKSDVYSFGVVLLELITGRKAISNDMYIVNWAKSMVAEGNIEKLIDPRLHGDYDINTAWKVVELALTCVDNISSKRPTMNDVVTDIKSCVKADKALHGAEQYDLNRHMSLCLESMQGPNLR
ncbi:cysteine-rich RLK (RECEPTOR-like protein kinase) 10 [Artemisia annua]|uniref:Cysteine-rich RLK (RECEPTOR-like protein kinase) 10 n=1 Tax=Artemisia annua TaxID=35608 RepID=A0A2U1PT70_ARTAN|nr:cysteine-rich RLK (RECEPTOR-like protein kinase) 10 [Artemisia annua]